MKKILIIQTAFIGDAVLTLPMIEKLKESIHDSFVDVICIPSTAEIFSSSPAINDTIILEKHGKHKSITGLISFIKEIRKKNYDFIYTPHRSLRTAIIVLLSGVTETTGFSNSALKFAFKNVVDYGYNKHEVQRNLDLIDYKYSEESWKIIPQIKISSESKNKVNAFLKENNLRSGFIIVCPGSVWETKRYPFEYFIDIINLLLKKDSQVVLSGGEKDSEITSKIKQEFSENVFDAAGRFSLIESIELFKHAGLVLTNDSAPTHLGMCAGVKVLTIYCSTVPYFGFYPYNAGSRHISYDDLYCKPCGIHGYISCPTSTFECAKKINPETVVKTINDMIF